MISPLACRSPDMKARMPFHSLFTMASQVSLDMVKVTFGVSGLHSLTRPLTLPCRWLQGHVIVKPNLLSFKLLAGYGYLFFGYALLHGPLLGRFKMVY